MISIMISGEEGKRWRREQLAGDARHGCGWSLRRRLVEGPQHGEKACEGKEGVAPIYPADR